MKRGRERRVEGGRGREKEQVGRKRKERMRGDRHN